MKKGIITGLLLLVLIAFGRGQSQELQQLVLNVEKLVQFKQILKDLEKSYAILSRGYNTIRNISQGNFRLHQEFLDGLLAVSPAVKKYRRIRDIVNGQLLLVRESRNALSRFSRDGYVHPEELNYMRRVYDNLIRESIQQLDDLITIITAGKLRMSDEERLAGIDRIYGALENKLSFLQDFNAGAAILSGQREQAAADLNTLHADYGLR